MAERKKYIDVKVPILESTMRVLGTPEELHNKTIKLDLTRKLRGKGLTLTLRLINQEGKIIAIPNRMELVTAYIRRTMRNRVDYVEDSFRAQCEEVRVIIKPFLITRKRVSRAVRKNLRNTAKEFITEYIKEKDYNSLCHEILSGTLQQAMLPKLKKVYPLSFCDLRVFETKELEKIDFKKASEKEIEKVPEENDKTKNEGKEKELEEQEK